MTNTAKQEQNQQGLVMTPNKIICEENSCIRTQSPSKSFGHRLIADKMNDIQKCSEVALNCLTQQVDFKL